MSQIDLDACPKCGEPLSVEVSVRGWLTVRGVVAIEGPNGRWVQGEVVLDDDSEIELRGEHVGCTACDWSAKLGNTLDVSRG